MFKELFTEDTDRGVSPVIGVILMVAITVILAAVIGAFVLGLGDQVSNSAPQAQWQFEFEDPSVTIAHGGGENVDNSTIDVRIGSTTAYATGTHNNTDAYNTSGWANPIETGSEIEIEANQSGAFTGDNPTTGETVRVVWVNPSGDSSNIIAERDWPN